MVERYLQLISGAHFAEFFSQFVKKNSTKMNNEGEAKKEMIKELYKGFKVGSPQKLASPTNSPFFTPSPSHSPLPTHLPSPFHSLAPSRPHSPLP